MVASQCNLQKSRMNNPQGSSIDLQAAARQTMLEHGFEPDFPPGAQQELD
jgi:hypothetical protein